MLAVATERRQCYLSSTTLEEAMPSSHRKPPNRPAFTPLTGPAGPTKRSVTGPVRKVSQERKVLAEETRTTTIKLPHDLKSLLGAAAAAVGKSPHAFMVEAIASAVTSQEARRSFVADALAAEAEFDKTGVSVSGEAVDAFLKARAAGKKPPLPKGRSWRK